MNYLGIANYYDKRKCAVTLTWDWGLWAQHESVPLMVSAMVNRSLGYAFGIVTGYADFDYVQNEVINPSGNLVEICSHSHTHPSIPYADYEKEVKVSRDLLISNLILPNFQRFASKEKIYGWIDPYGQCDDNVLNWLRRSGYFWHRGGAKGYYGLADWDNEHKKFHRYGTAGVMGINWGTWNAPWYWRLLRQRKERALNCWFDAAYGQNGVYHLYAHPHDCDWSAGSVAHQHLDYIANRKDCWYAPLMALYLVKYLRTVATFGVTKVALPAEIVWTKLTEKTSDGFFNGIEAVRWDVGKVYVSVAFPKNQAKFWLRFRPTDEVFEVWTSQEEFGKYGFQYPFTLEFDITEENEVYKGTR